MRTTPVPPGRYGGATTRTPSGAAPRRRVPPRTLRMDADIVRHCPDSYRLYGPGRTCVELSGRFAERLVGALRRLDGTVTLDDACRRLLPDEQRLLENLLTRLRRLGMVHKLPYLPAPARIGVIGEGASAERLRAILAADHRVRGFTEPLPPRGERARPPRYSAAPATDRLEHWLSVDDARLDLVVVAGSRTAPDPVVPWLLSRLGLAHLIVGVHRHDACVGPLVQPGITSCAFCAAGSPIGRGHRHCAVAAPTPSALDWAAAITNSVCAAYLDERIVPPTVEFGGGIWPSRRPRPDCPLCTRSTQLPTAPPRAPTVAGRGGGSQPPDGWSSPGARAPASTSSTSRPPMMASTSCP